MTQFRIFIVFFVAISVFVSCGPVLKREYLDYQHAEEFLPCPSDKIENPRAHALLAIQTSLAATDWVIQRISSDEFEIVGRKCRENGSRSIDYLKRPDYECTSVLFMAKENAKIFAIVPDKKRVHKSMLYKTYSWIGELDRNYSEIRCYNDEKLIKYTPESRER